MYEPTEYGNKKPVFILFKGKWVGIGVLAAKSNQAAYKYAHSIGLTKWVSFKKKLEE